MQQNNRAAQMALLNIHEEIMQDQETPWMRWEGGREGRKGEKGKAVMDRWSNRGRKEKQEMRR